MTIFAVLSEFFPFWLCWFLSGFGGSSLPPPFMILMATLPSSFQTILLSDFDGYSPLLLSK